MLSSVGPKCIAAFGGARVLWRALQPHDLELTPMTVYRWGWPRSKNRGTGGVVPVRRLALIMAVAQDKGIRLDLTLEDILDIGR